MPCRQLNI